MNRHNGDLAYNDRDRKKLAHLKLLKILDVDRLLTQDIMLSLEPMKIMKNEGDASLAISIGYQEHIGLLGHLLLLMFLFSHFTQVK